MLAATTIALAVRQRADYDGRSVDMAKLVEQILETIVGDVTMSVMAVDGVDCLVTVQKLGSKAADVPDSASGKMKNVAITKDWLKTGLVWKGYDIVLGHCSTHLRPVKKAKK